MAKPTNSVLVIVGAASGCCATDCKADATALPSLIAGNMQPIPVVKPAVIIDAIAIIVMLSICYLLF
jgi:hypothetical protein